MKTTQGKLHKIETYNVYKISLYCFVWSTSDENRKD